MIKFLYSVFEACWRRAFGSGDFNRLILHIINVIATLFVLWYLGYSLLQNILVVSLYEAFYWSVGHGPAFDMGRGGKPDEEMIERYKKYFWNKWCEFLVPKEYWYTFGYDFLWMMFRYEIPAAIIAVILCSPFFSLAGLFVSSIYAACWTLQDREKLKRLTATEVAEIISGFITGILLVI